MYNLAYLFKFIYFRENLLFGGVFVMQNNCLTIYYMLFCGRMCHSYYPFLCIYVLLYIIIIYNVCICCAFSAVLYEIGLN